MWVNEMGEWFGWFSLGLILVVGCVYHVVTNWRGMLATARGIIHIRTSATSVYATHTGSQKNTAVAPMTGSGEGVAANLRHYRINVMREEPRTNEIWIDNKMS